MGNLSGARLLIKYPGKIYKRADCNTINSQKVRDVGQIKMSKCRKTKKYFFCLSEECWKENFGWSQVYFNVTMDLDEKTY